MEKCEHQKVSKQSGKRAYASKYLGNCHPNYVGFNSWPREWFVYRPFLFSLHQYYDYRMRIKSGLINI